MFIYYNYHYLSFTRSLVIPGDHGEVWNMVRYRTRYVPFFWILLILLASISGIVAAAPDQKGQPVKGEPRISEAPVSAAFIEAAAKGFPTADRKNTPGNRGLGSIPSPLDKTHLKGKKISREMLLATGSPGEEGTGGPIVGALPASFDLRTTGRVSPVKDQGACGSCWAFASYGSLESTLLPAQLWDFSENNLKNTHGFDLAPCSGGNDAMSTAYLARWSGPVSEADDPYSASSTTSPTGLTTRKHVQDVYNIPPRASSLDNDNIKNAVQTYGGLYSTIYWTSTSYNSVNRAYYYNGASSSNHAIAIVGWDDLYDRNKFTTVAPGNGAFLVKNSWGTSWGASGYFYVSYYDTQIGRDNTVFTAQETTNYNRVYQYDPLGWTSSLGYSSDTAWFANVFTAAADENLAAVSFYTPSTNAVYQVQVYRDPTSGPINTAGAVTTQSGTISLPGYHTVTLTTPVALTSGHKFSIVVRLQSPGYNYPVPMESPISGYSSGATSSAGQSYISSAGTTWTDLTTYYTNRNVCVKGFTTTGTPTNNPVPTLSTISPSSATAGGAAFTLTVTGGNFISSSKVRWNGADRTTTVLSATQATAAIQATDIATAGTASVTVFNPTPGGGTSGAQTFTIMAASNPVAAITTLSPSAATAGGSAFTMTVTGSNFITTSKVRWNGADRTTTYVSATQLTAAIPATDIATAGTASVTVFNPAPGGGNSSGVTFTINAANNPVAAITTLSPGSATAGGAAFTLTVTGTNFITSSKVRWNGADRTTTYVSATQLTAAISATDIATSGTASVTVFNPAPGGGTSLAKTFTITAANNPVPSITTLTPNPATAGGPAFTLTVTGTGFVSTSKVRWNGADRTTTYVSATQLTAAIPATDIAVAGTPTITVFNPAPGGGTSTGKTFTINAANNPVAAITTLSPGSATAGGAAFTLTVTGTNFITSSKVRWNGADRTTTYVSATQLTAAISATDIATSGTASVTVFNPAPGGGTSLAKTFTITAANNPVPSITTLTPNPATAGGPAFTLTVTGTGFVSTSKVRWNGADRTTTYVSATQLTAAIPATDIAVAGTPTITVFNPAPGGGTSTGKTFTVNNPVPSITTLSPISAAAGGPAFTLTLTGTGFVSTSKVRWNGVDRTTTYVSATQLTAAIPAADIASAGSASVTVFSPAPGGGTSSAKTFTINPVSSPPPTASFSGTPVNGKSPLKVQFTDTSTGNPTSWTWDFGDGITSTLKNPSHDYTVNGRYTVKLTVRNAGGSSTSVKTNYIKVR
jgi:C1A family cysteine protease/PKD repeat protein